MMGIAVREIQILKYFLTSSVFLNCDDVKWDFCWGGC